MTGVLRLRDRLEPDRVRPGLPQRLPTPFGSLGEHLLFHLRRRPHGISPLLSIDVDLLADDDGSLALHLLWHWPSSASR